MRACRRHGGRLFEWLAKPIRGDRALANAHRRDEALVSEVRIPAGDYGAHYDRLSAQECRSPARPKLMNAPQVAATSYPQAAFASLFAARDRYVAVLGAPLAVIALRGMMRVGPIAATSLPDLCWGVADAVNEAPDESRRVPDDCQGREHAANNWYHAVIDADHTVNERQFIASGMACAARVRLFAAKMGVYTARCPSAMKSGRDLAVQNEAGERKSVALAAYGMPHVANTMALAANNVSCTANGMADAALDMADAVNDVSDAACGTLFTAESVLFTAKSTPGTASGVAQVLPVLNGGCRDTSKISRR
jgi:hypothetical protein